MEKRSLLNDRRKYWLLGFLYVLVVSLTKTTFAPYLKARGLETGQIHQLFSIFSIVVMLMEIPSSAIGERMGPRNSFLLGVLLKSCAAFLMAFGSVFQHFLYAEIISACSVSFISGSLDAWMMHRMKTDSVEKNEKNLFVFTFSDRINKFALAGGGLFGMWLGEGMLVAPWLGVGTGFLVVLVSSWWMLGDEKISNAKSPHASMQTVLAGYRLIRSKPVLMLILVDGFFLGFLLASPKMFWIPYLKEEFGQSTLFIGKMWLVLNLLQWLGTYGVVPVYHRLKSSLYMKALFSGVTLVLMIGLAFSQASLLAFMTFYFLLEWARPFHALSKLSIVHTQTEDEGRLTVLSLEESIGKLGAAAGLGFVGLFPKTIPLNQIWLWMVGISFIVIPLFYVQLLKEKKAA